MSRRLLSLPPCSDIWLFACGVGREIMASMRTMMWWESLEFLDSFRESSQREGRYALNSSVLALWRMGGVGEVSVYSCVHK